MKDESGVVATPFELETLQRFRVQRARTVEGCFGMGEVLCEVKEKLPHGRWLLWLESAQLAARSAQKLMHIYQDARLQALFKSNARRESYLPPSQETLYQLSTLTDGQFGTLVDAGKIHPEMRRGDLKRAQAAAAHGEATPLRDALAPGPLAA